MNAESYLQILDNYVRSGLDNAENLIFIQNGAPLRFALDNIFQDDGWDNAGLQKAQILTQVISTFRVTPKMRCIRQNLAQ